MKPGARKSDPIVTSDGRKCDLGLSVCVGFGSDNLSAVVAATATTDTARECPRGTVVVAG